MSDDPVEVTQRARDAASAWLGRPIDPAEPGEGELAEHFARFEASTPTAQSESAVTQDAQGAGDWERVRAFDAAQEECRRVAAETKFSDDVFPSEREWYVKGVQVCAAMMGMLASDAAKSLWPAAPSPAAQQPVAEGVRSVEAAAIDQNDAMRQELNHVGNLVSDLARAMGVDQANPDGSWPDLAGRLERLRAAALTAQPTVHAADGSAGEQTP